MAAGHLQRFLKSSRFIWIGKLVRMGDKKKYTQNFVGNIFSKIDTFRTEKRIYGELYQFEVV